MSDSQMEQSFAEMFEASEMEMKPELRVGNRIKGKIIAVGEEMVYVDTGTKSDGVIDKHELLDKDGAFSMREGDEVELYVVSMQGSQIRLARALGGEGGMEQLQQAMEERIPVEGKIKEVCKGGFRVRVLDKIAFCPLSQVDKRPVTNPDDLVGQSMQFLITRIEERGRNIVVSRRVLLDLEQAQSLAEFLERTKVGDVLQGTVTRLAPFGAFVEVAPGLEGLVHVSELGWSRNNSPEDVVAAGDQVTVKLLKVDDQGKGHVRLELSMKQAMEDPWAQIAADVQVGAKITGRVTNLAPFGAFVEILPGIEGLVHVSEMSYLKRVHKPGDVVAVGESVPVMVKSIDLQTKRIGLSMRDAEGDPWDGLADRYKKGQVVQGILEKRETFGMFVQLEPGVVGLLPASRLERSADDIYSKAKPGETLPVAVDVVDLEKRRISLGLPDAEQNEDWKSHAVQEGPMGSLGEQLKKAMEQK
ncbi:SSU ribosomal protein S1P [Desulfonatronum thiosulfatophilum]|uniref:SSU ribosomal protein S1P n=1 Tax=Desulfonatronum thiosulfatophilum TaxID=617002 RepID=A0A1G6E2U3_9BACT|nr:30S ribosomal protein S1 [Desulfonatronum thiosulfatophilum]SDB51692.1 SSU ribosomal protein S1P [Desulfonatronum thiosulfatophilum]